MPVGTGRGLKTNHALIKLHSEAVRTFRAALFLKQSIFALAFFSDHPILLVGGRKVPKRIC